MSVVANPASAQAEDVEKGERFGELRSRQAPSNLAWKDLNLKIGNKQVLTKVSGHVNAGELCALMGPSGSGKSSTLNAIAGRVLNGGKVKLSGKVAVNGAVVQPAVFRRKIAYVLQEDNLYATATARESLEFSAKLRLPRDVSPQARKRIVDDLLASLGLEGVQNTQVGSELRRGLSGGEKKRVSIGVELVTQPSILFLDEPTSGLDSFSAIKVVRILKNLAAQGSCAILCTIHQPSTEIFELFDTTLMLKSGHVIYNGSVKQLPEKLASFGFPIPDRTNPADFILETAQVRPLEELFQYNPDSDLAIEDMIQGPEQQDENEAATLAEMRKPGVCTQIAELFRREGRNVVRAKSKYVIQVVITAFLNILYSLIFKGTADPLEPGYSYETAFRALTLIMMSAMFGSAQGPLLTFPLERAITVREMQTGTYGPVPYFFSKFAVELPEYLLTAGVSLLVTYWIIGFTANFAYLLFIIWILMLAASSYAFILGAAVSDAKNAQQFAPIVLVPQLLWSGTFIPITAIPSYLQWVQYIAALVYGSKLAAIAEFNDNPYCDAQCQNTILVANNANPSDSWLYITVLIGIAVGFRLVSLAVLIYRARFFAN